MLARKRAVQGIHNVVDLRSRRQRDRERGRSRCRVRIVVAEGKGQELGVSESGARYILEGCVRHSTHDRLLRSNGDRNAIRSRTGLRAKPDEADGGIRGCAEP